MKHLISGVLLSTLCLLPVEALAHNRHHRHTHTHNHCHTHPHKGIRHCHKHRRGAHHPRGVRHAPYYPIWFPHPQAVIEFNVGL